MSRISEIAILSIISATMAFTGCQEKRIDTDASTSKAVSSSEDCFVNLHPGPVKSGKITEVTFQHGACIGEYKALNKATKRKQVFVAPKSDPRLEGAPGSFLYAADGVVSVDRNGQKDPIGKLARLEVGTRLVLDPGVEIQLMVSDGSSAKAWSLADGARKWKSEEILIVIPN